MSDDLKPLSKKHQRVLDEYLVCFKQWKAYQTVYPNVTYDSARQAAARLFADVNFSAHLQARLEEAHLSANEALKLNADIARADMSELFRVVDEWMFDPLPEYEILDEREVEDDTKDPPEKRTSYRVKHVVLDSNKILDPRFARRIKKYTNSRKAGLSIELYPADSAIDRALKVHGKYKELGDKDNPINMRLEIVKASEYNKNSNQ